MITFDFVKKIHRLLEKFPVRLGEFKILYPEAFKKVDITEDVKFKLSGRSFMTFMLYDGEDYFGEMKPFVQTLWIVDKQPCCHFLGTRQADRPISDLLGK